MPDSRSSDLFVLSLAGSAAVAIVFTYVLNASLPPTDLAYGGSAFDPFTVPVMFMGAGAIGVVVFLASWVILRRAPPWPSAALLVGLAILLILALGLPGRLGTGPYLTLLALPGAPLLVIAGLGVLEWRARRVTETEAVPALAQWVVWSAVVLLAVPYVVLAV